MDEPDETSCGIAPPSGPGPPCTRPFSSSSMDVSVLRTSRGGSRSSISDYGGQRGGLHGKGSTDKVVLRHGGDGVEVDAEGKREDARAHDGVAEEERRPCPLQRLGHALLAVSARIPSSCMRGETGRTHIAERVVRAVYLQVVQVPVVHLHAGPAVHGQIGVGLGHYLRPGPRLGHGGAGRLGIGGRGGGGGRAGGAGAGAGGWRLRSPSRSRGWVCGHLGRRRAPAGCVGVAHRVSHEMLCI